MYGTTTSKIHHLPIYPTICCFQNKNQTKEKSSKIRNGKADVMQTKFGNYFERLNTNDYARIQCIRNWITWHIGMLDLCLFGLIITETQS